MAVFYLFIALLIVQDQVPLKPLREFEIISNYELKKKPTPEHARIVFEQPEEKKSTSTDMLPFLSIKLKVKKWTEGVTQVKVADNLGKVHLKKKPNDDGIFEFDLGYVDDIKDKVAPGIFFITFHKEKKIVEQITVTVAEDGTFLVNGEKRGKF
jgi:hypothetical protein